MKGLYSLLALNLCLLVPSLATAVTSPPEYCDYVIPKQVGAWTNNELGCYLMKNPSLCIATCKRVCEQTYKECAWSLDELTQCYMGCERGPRISAEAGRADETAAALAER